MNGERFLVTGALGRIGAWVVKRLVMDDAQLAQVRQIAGDIIGQAGFERAIA